MRHASIAMSWVAAQKATNSAHSAMRVTLLDGSLSERLSNPKPIPNCASSIQLRRRPSTRVSSGSGTRSTTGAHRNFSE